MRLDAEQLAAAAATAELGEVCDSHTVHTALCRTAEPLTQALQTGDRCLVACTQEIASFEKMAQNLGASDKLDFVNIREAAAWSTGSDDVSPKILALLAAAAVDRSPDRQIDLRSSGRTVVLGAGQMALDVAHSLAERLDVILVLEAADDIVLPVTRPFPVYFARTPQASGAIGRFKIVFEHLAEVLPWSRGDVALSPLPNPMLDADLILDLSERAALFPDHQRRTGYLKADGRVQGQVARACFEITGLIGPLAKPVYVQHDPAKCVHAAVGRTNCTRCLDVCPTGANTSSGNAIHVDATICAGCGSCSSLCPTSAMTYIAPSVEEQRRVLAVLLETYKAAGGERPLLLIHSNAKGEQAIAYLARQGDGLPSHVLPWAMRRPTSVGLDLLCLALALGAVRVVIQVDPEHEIEAAALYEQAELCGRLFADSGSQISPIEVLCTVDPDKIHSAVTCDVGTPHAADTVTPPPLHLASNELVRYCVERGAAGARTDAIALPPGAPFGSVSVSDTCTLCLACTRVCPVDALIGNENRTRLDFIEARCVQCGMCAATCPERAITLEPQLDLSENAVLPRGLKEDVPALCTSCGRAFGSQRTIDGVVSRLTVSGWSAQNADLIDRLRLCESCRITSPARTPGH